MLDKLRLLSRLVRSLTRPGRSTRHSHPSAIAEPIEPRLLLTTFIRYVDANAPAGGTQNGLSWSTAYRDLQSALSAANPSTNDTYEVRVADGAYLPTARTTSSDPRSATFSLKKRIHLYGSYGGYGAVDPDARDITAHSTILSGDLGVSGNNSDNSYHVLLGSGTDNTAVLDGFAIIAGNAGADAPQDGGGGMYTVSGSPVLRNCLFAGNTAAGQNWGGGGMCNVDSAPVLINCVFRGNATDGAGGAMYNMRS